jgi:hypothetical protein
LRLEEIWRRVHPGRSLEVPACVEVRSFADALRMTVVRYPIGTGRDALKRAPTLPLDAPKFVGHSVRRAFMGWMEAARLAGITAAQKEQTASATAAIVRASGSQEGTP